jgi:hypothetical protein
MNNQGSVEWLELALVNTILTHEQVMQTIGLFEQAKRMHWEENANTWNNAINAVEKDKWDSFEQYYSETYGGNNAQ